MTLLEVIGSEVMGFLGIRSWIDMAAFHGYSSLLTYQEIMSAIEPLFPRVLPLSAARSPERRAAAAQPEESWRAQRRASPYAPRQRVSRAWT